MLTLFHRWRGHTLVKKRRHNAEKLQATRLHVKNETRSNTRMLIGIAIYFIAYKARVRKEKNPMRTLHPIQEELEILQLVSKF